MGRARGPTVPPAAADGGPGGEPAPHLGPEEKPSPTELAKLARRLLHELAEEDPNLAAKLRSLGIGHKG
jgi:hypothetical protein